MKFLKLVLIFSFTAMITLPAIVYASEVKTFNVPAGTTQSLTFNLNSGDEVSVSISVSGGNNDVNFWATDPSGYTVVRTQGIVGGTDLDFKASRDGAYTLFFDNSFSLITSKLVTVTYDIKHPVLSGGGCLIATATYGSELASQVQQLRELRDNSLLQTESGTSFMTGFNQFYYSFSPTIADWERESPAFKEFVKITLTPMISSLSILNYVNMDSEASVLGYGISLIMLNVGMYFVTPAIIVMKVKSKISK